MKLGVLGIALSVLLTLPTAAWSQASSASPAGGEASLQNPGGASPTYNSDHPPTFKVDVKLVSVFASVVDGNGTPITNLKKDDFQVLEDGQPQTIAVFDRESQLPLSIVLAVDTSLSTRKDLPLELVSARRFAHSVLRPIDRLAVFQFSETVTEVVPFTSDLKRVDRGISSIKVGTATALYDAIYLGSEALHGREGRKVIIIITDGGDTVSSVSYKEAVRAALESEAMVYSIIIVPIEASAGRDLGGEHALIQLSRDTGGAYYYAESVASLDRAFRQINDELRVQYLLAYYPVQRLASSDFRRIEVRVRPEDGSKGALQARYRTGYYTSKMQ